MPTLAPRPADRLAKDQFRAFSSLSNTIAVGPDDQRRVLLLSPKEWADWSAFLDDGPLPAQPELPVLLRRLGKASYRLAVIAERHAA
jgi:hypothetical protein